MQLDCQMEIPKQLGIDDTWRDELIEMANNLIDATGIDVQIDDVY